MTIPDFSKLKGPQFTEKHFRFHYKEFLGYINSNYSFLDNFQERLHWYVHGLKEKPKCTVCGNLVVFEGFTKGYRKYCSRKCMNSDPIKKNKTKATCLKKFGVEVPSQSQIIKDKSKATCLERYGDPNYNNREQAHQTLIKQYGGIGNASKIIKEKQRQTMIDVHGSTSYNNKEQRRQTLMARYGVDHQSKLPKVQQKIRDSRRIFEKHRHDFILDYTDDGSWICKCPDSTCTKCAEKQYAITALQYEWRINCHMNPCTIATPINSGNNKDTSIEQFVQKILDGCGVKYQCSVPILDKKHIDIYIPDLKLGFECNGLYHHSSTPSTFAKSSSYHINKTNAAIEKGIRLIHLWQDWIQLYPDTVKSMILNYVGKTPNKIGARKCQIEITAPTKEYKTFFRENHIQNYSGCSIIIGLRYNDEIVSAMSFGCRKGIVSGNSEWELIRFCSKKYTTVQGAASKLLNEFIRTYNPTKITSYASRDISCGNIYKKLGFVEASGISKSYWYVQHKTLQRFHRSSFTKLNLRRLGWLDLNDKTSTEFDIMNKQPYFRIHDSGMTKWVLKTSILDYGNT